MSLKNLEQVSETDINENDDQHAKTCTSLACGKFHASLYLDVANFVKNKVGDFPDEVRREYDCLVERITIDDKEMLSGTRNEDSVYDYPLLFNTLQSFLKLNYNRLIFDLLPGKDNSVFKSGKYRMFDLKEYKEKILPLIDNNLAICEYLLLDNNAKFTKQKERLERLKNGAHVFIDDNGDAKVMIRNYDETCQLIEETEFNMEHGYKYTVLTSDLYLLYLRANFVYQFMVYNDDWTLKSLDDTLRDLRDTYVTETLIPLTIAHFNIPVTDGKYEKYTKVHNPVLMFASKEIDNMMDYFFTNDMFKKMFPETCKKLSPFFNYTSVKDFLFDKFFKTKIVGVGDKYFDMTFISNVFFEYYRLDIPMIFDPISLINIKQIAGISSCSMLDEINQTTLLRDKMPYNHVSLNKYVLSEEEYNVITVYDYLRLLIKNAKEDFNMVAELLHDDKKSSIKHLLERERETDIIIRAHENLNQHCKQCVFLTRCKRLNTPDDDCFRRSIEQRMGQYLYYKMFTE